MIDKILRIDRGGSNEILTLKKETKHNEIYFNEIHNENRRKKNIISRQ